MHDVTRIMSGLQHGDPTAAAGLLPLVYDELRALAAQRIAAERPGQTLQATALLHEAYVRLVGPAGATRGAAEDWNGRGHFFAAAAEAMRRILVDQARRRNSLKRGGGGRRVDLEAGATLAAPQADQGAEELIALDEALRAFEAEDPLKARLVKLRYFAGLSVDEAAVALGISPATVKRHWAYARSWLYGKLKGR